MSTLRTFVAVEMSPQVRSRAADLVERLRVSQVKATWIKPDNMHLTLKFLGDTPENLIADVAQELTEAARGQQPFTIRVAGAGAFPDTRRPRTVWIGVQEGRQEICELAGRIEAALTRLGIRRERRSYSPHLTIARVRGSGPKQGELGQAVAANQDFEAGTTSVAEVVLFASYLEPSGARYEALARAPLGR
jgi:2'-5' RNA ligase